MVGRGLTASTGPATSVIQGVVHGDVGSPENRILPAASSHLVSTTWKPVLVGLAI